MMMTGMSNVVTQAPSVNFETVTTRTVVAVATAPSPLTNILRRDFLPPARLQWATMPPWDSVKARKAPTA